MLLHDFANFQDTVWRYYDAHGRHDMPWRQPDRKDMFDPYKIMVSEIMLQQTQVTRVIVKYKEFLAEFPTVQVLAAASLGDVLRAWQGLGYNRRAKFLHQAATIVTHQLGGEFPRTITELVKLPGVGKNTAGAIIAYSWDQPVIFIETNIRTVFIHHFFHDQQAVSDADILALVEKTLPADQEQTRVWYWALMDYGAHVKQTVGNLNKLSKTYTKQSTFHGSVRQLRGAVLRELSTAPQTRNKLCIILPDKRLPSVLQSLQAEGMITRKGSTFSL